MWVSVSLNSSSALREFSKKRFYLDTALLSVSRVHIGAFEASSVNYFTTQVSYVYFSEQWDNDVTPYFRGTILPGKYTSETIGLAVATAMCCARCLNYAKLVPSNTYDASVSTEQQLLVVKSRGSKLFALHNNQGPYHAVVVGVDGAGLKLNIYASKETPICKGALVKIFNDELGSVQAQVTQSVGATLVLRCSVSVVPVTGSCVTVVPFSLDNSCHDVLGFRGVDTPSDTWTDVVGAGVYQQSDVQGHTLILTLANPTYVENDGFVLLKSRSGSQFQGTVVGVTSGTVSSYVVVRVDSVMLVGDLVSELVGYKSVNLEFGHNTVCVGTYKVDLKFNQRVMFIRLWLGSTEVTTTLLPLAKGTAEVFGRVQLRVGGDKDTVFACQGEGSVVGERTFLPPLEKVPYVDVELLNEKGVAFESEQLGNWSLLLRCCTVDSPK